MLYNECSKTFYFETKRSGGNDVFPMLQIKQNKVKK